MGNYVEDIVTVLGAILAQENVKYFPNGGKLYKVSPIYILATPPPILEKVFLEISFNY